MGFTLETDLEMAGKGGLVLGPNLKLGGLMEKPGVQDKAHISPSVKGKNVMFILLSKIIALDYNQFCS